MKKISILLACLVCFSNLVNSQSQPPLRIIVFGGHPDDCDLNVGGTAFLLARMGYAIKFVSLTSGDAGHHEMAPESIAARRRLEAQEAGSRLGVEYEVLDHHDGGLVPSLEARLQVVRKIREWNADVVITPRPSDYHPDHRYTGVLVQDAAYLVGVPNIAPDTPPLKKNPFFLYYEDDGQLPHPFRPDVAIDITSVIDEKIYALDAHESQFYEWLPWLGGYLSKVPQDKSERRKWLVGNRGGRISPEARASLDKWYGSKSKDVKYAEAFAVCEFGRPATEEDLRRIFPMLPQAPEK